MYLDDPRPTWAEISLGNLALNIRAIRQQVGARTRIMAVVKADGYGHGAVRIVPALLNGGADELGVALLAEAIELRSAGFHEPILILGWTPPQQAGQVVAGDLGQAVFSEDLARALSEAGVASGKRVRVHLKVDTGMGRLGFRVCEEDSVREILRIARLPHLDIEGIFTHLSTADERDKGFAYEQLELFHDFVEKLRREGLEIPVRHAANSAAILDLPESYLDLVRPGIMLYGLYPSPEVSRTVELHPVMTWKTKVSFVKRVQAGTSISYGRTFRAPREMEVATLPVGYADGYSRSLSNRGRVIVHGRLAPVVGRVCMDQIVVSLEGIPGVRPGDEVVLLGCQGEQEVSADDLASLLGTINYEIVCMVGKRVPRIYVG